MDSSMDWIGAAAAHVARAAGLDASDLLPAAAERELLLDLAGVAAHRSGDRTNAPILCHVLGRAVARGASLDELAAAVRDFAGAE